MRLKVDGINVETDTPEEAADVLKEVCKKPDARLQSALDVIQRAIDKLMEEIHTLQQAAELLSKCDKPVVVTPLLKPGMMRAVIAEMHEEQEAEANLGMGKSMGTAAAAATAADIQEVLDNQKKRSPKEMIAERSVPKFHVSEAKQTLIAKRGEQILLLLDEGVNTARELAERLGTTKQIVYLTCSKLNISLVQAKLDWEAKQVKDGPDGSHRSHCCKEHGCKYGGQNCPVVKGIVKQDFPCEDCSDQEAEVPPKDTGCGFTFGDTVFFRRFDGTHVRCSVVALPDANGEFFVKDPDGKNWGLWLKDKIQPFRDETPTFCLDVVATPQPGKPAVTLPSEPAITYVAPQHPLAWREKDVEVAPPPTVISPPSKPQTPSSLADGKVVVPFGCSFKCFTDAKSGRREDLRSETIKRQKGQPNKRVEFITTVECDHVHVAVVDRMGYGITQKDATGHIHSVIKWDMLSSLAQGEIEEHTHGITLTPQGV